MTRIIEREEGLFTRQGATRILCIFSLLGLPAIASIVILMVYLAMAEADAPLPELGRPFVLAWWILLASAGSVFVLWFWRRCDRCRRRLFADSSRDHFTRLLRDPAHRVWLSRLWWAKGLSDQQRDYRAKPFLGSYRNAAILKMALTGRLLCQWCNHEDGTKPAYVVTSPR